MVRPTLNPGQCQEGDDIQIDREQGSFERRHNLDHLHPSRD